jgi:hypothetical protein
MTTYAVKNHETASILIQFSPRDRRFSNRASGPGTAAVELAVGL